MASCSSTRDAMGTAAFPLVANQHESLRGSVLLSVLFHAGLFLGAFVYSLVGFRHGPGWGSPQVGRATRVNVVTSLPGVPLPAPVQTTRNTVVTENPGLYQPLPPPKPETPRAAEEIPKFKDAIRPEKSIRVNKRIQKEDLVRPPNAVPFGEQGRPAMDYSQFVVGASDGAISIGTADFGSRYGWYVQAVRNRISSNWLMATISPNITSARRVYVEFEILRDGTIADVKLTQSSGVPEVDRSALRAVYASNPLNPLPSDYSGRSVTVDFYFDFRR